MQKKKGLDRVEDAIEDIRLGKVVIVVDDEDRENEGDFICAAECVTPEIINFMAMHGRGLICAPITESRAKELMLDLMVEESTALHATAFTVSIDYKGKGCTTGISAYDRATGIRALVDPTTKPADFGRPGHIFPLKAKDGGVLRRTGHTEATIDLARMAGFSPAGVLVEILNEDGSMARLPQLLEIAAKHGLKIISIKDMVAHRMATERLISKEIEVVHPSKWGLCRIIAYTQLTSNDTHLAVVMGNWNADDPVLVRVHSSTETGDILGALFDDQGIQLQQAMQAISTAGAGVLLFMRQRDSRNLIHNLKELNKPRSQKTEQRDFGVGAQILRDLGITKIRLLTNSPKRRVALDGYGLKIIENVQLGPGVID
ncbi:MAG: 3,4-dihydroxy-2-butanone-4-phosphate synthase [Saprospiraceae bacterium]|nr:3,4-dihydroxy-2-butanone-4-phosphate synthase [Saprospiraceae bacterium]